MKKANIFDNYIQYFPLREDKEIIELTDEQVEKIENGELIVINNKLVENGESKKAAARIFELKQKLANTDYQAIKYAEGAMSAAEYAPYKADRAKWRAEINDLEKKL